MLLRMLLFDLATWHMFAKLRLHTDTTLDDFRAITSALEKSVCMFIKDVCSLYNTMELPKETAVQER